MCVGVCLILNKNNMKRIREYKYKIENLDSSFVKIARFQTPYCYLFQIQIHVVETVALQAS